LYHPILRRVLVTWVGRTDLRAPTEAAVVGLGPIAQALGTLPFDEAFLLSDYPEGETSSYVTWLRGRTNVELHVLAERLTGPTNFGEIYQAAVRGCLRARGTTPDATALTFHLSPGTPAMAAVWIILGKTRFPAELIESSKEHGVRTAAVPFDISADFLPDVMRAQDERLREGSAAAPPAAPAFADIVFRSRVMERLIERARLVAVRNVPVLIEGESGTGKELLARAIHQASPRQGQPFITINCGAIPAELIESLLFGHEKGAFTGAATARKGAFEDADGGTLFLDELGELPLAAQVKLLRALQEGEVQRVGATRPQKVDVRIVAATNRTLTDEIQAGRFREDLFYRLAVAVLKIPALRERPGDLGLLMDRLLTAVNHEATVDLGAKQKKFSAAARNVLAAHDWPGNVRELYNTLRRAALWSDGETISADDAREALLPVRRSSRAEILGRPLADGLDLPNLLRDVAQHYLGRALDEAQGNKTRAAELVGLPSYQTFSNWLDRYDVNRGTKSG
jgi:DNA-binding NtrC family response regulator